MKDVCKSNFVVHGELISAKFAANRYFDPQTEIQQQRVTNLPL